MMSANFNVTPGKLLNPIGYTAMPKNFKPLHAYLNEINQKRCFRKNFNNTLEKNKIADVQIYKSGILSGNLRKSKSKLNKSCRIKRIIEEKNSTTRDYLAIPHLSYKHFEKSHFPNVRNKILIKTFQPPPLEKVIKEVPEEIQEKPSILVPKRITIQTHSERYLKKIKRISKVLSMIEQEHEAIPS